MSDHEYINLISRILAKQVKVCDLQQHEFYELFEEAASRVTNDFSAEKEEELQNLEEECTDLKATAKKDFLRWYDNGQKIIKLRNAAYVGRIEKYTKATLKAKLDEFDRLLEGL